jgi:hypothetical protein
LEEHPDLKGQPAKYKGAVHAYSSGTGFDQEMPDECVKYFESSELFDACALFQVTSDVPLPGTGTVLVVGPSGRRF